MPENSNIHLEIPLPTLPSILPPKLTSLPHCDHPCTAASPLCLALHTQQCPPPITLPWLTSAHTLPRLTSAPTLPQLTSAPPPSDAESGGPRHPDLLRLARVPPRLLPALQLRAGH